MAYLFLPHAKRTWQPGRSTLTSIWLGLAIQPESTARLRQACYRALAGIEPISDLVYPPLLLGFSVPIGKRSLDAEVDRRVYGLPNTTAWWSPDTRGVRSTVHGYGHLCLQRNAICAPCVCWLSFLHWQSAQYALPKLFEMLAYVHQANFQRGGMACKESVDG